MNCAPDEKAMEVIERISPMLQQFLTSGDEEFLHESLNTLEGMFFLGFSPEMIKELTLRRPGSVSVRAQ